MKVLQSKSLLVGGIAGALAVTTALGAWAVGNNTLPSGTRLAAIGDEKQAAAAEKHPELRRALKALQNAQTDLQKAAHDFAGHREKALDLTQKAITEVNEALASDKK